jgi:stage II sporulation protein D
MFCLAVSTLLSLFAAFANPQTPVRIGLFGLFEAQQVEVRPGAGDGFSVNAGSLNGVVIGSGEVLRVRRNGPQLQLAVVDAYGRLKQTAAAEQARLLPLHASTLRLSLPRQLTREVRGQLQISVARQQAPGALRLVLLSEREAAVASVVAAEMSGLTAGESLKALAVMVRTFIASHPDRHAAEGFDFCDTTHCQLYRGEADLSAQRTPGLVERCVSATEGEVLRFQHRPLEGHYTAVCGGRTARPERVWGGSTRSGYPYEERMCRWCAASPYAKWQRRADASAVLAALAAITGRQLSPASELQLENYPQSEVVRSVVIKDRGRRVVMSGDEFRRAIGRRIGWNRVLSPTFTLEHLAGSFIFRGRGFGSQVGLCVAGAAAQAAAGRSYKEILNFYYPQTEID